MIDRATVNPPNPESKIPIAALFSMTTQAYGAAQTSGLLQSLSFDCAATEASPLP